MKHFHIMIVCCLFLFVAVQVYAEDVSDARALDAIFDLNTSSGKRFSADDLEPDPVVLNSDIGSLYRVKNADTSPLLYSPELDMMVNPDCPTESMEGTIRKQIGYDCNGSNDLQAIETDPKVYKRTK